MTRSGGATRAGIVALLLAVGASAEAQDLEPRAYSPAPVGTQFLHTFGIRFQHAGGG